MSIPHGTILSGTSTLPDLDDGIRAYRDFLGLDLVEIGKLPPRLVESWGCNANAGAPYAILRPRSGEECWFRLIEQAPDPAFVPMTTYGWAAFECSVEDVDRWPTVLPEDLFEVRGMPKTPSTLEPTFRAMQTLGPGQEMLYLNQVLTDPIDTDLPRARSPIDRIFIAVLAAEDRAACVDWYCRKLGLDHAADHTLPYSMINLAFDRPPESLTKLSMVHNGRMPIIEIDSYPEAAGVRPLSREMLPQANALVTLAVGDLDACDVEWRSSPAVFPGPPYEGRRCATTIGAAGELIECVEVGFG